MNKKKNIAIWYLLFSIILIVYILLNDKSGQAVKLTGESFRGTGGYFTEDGALCIDESCDLQTLDRKTASLILNSGTYDVTIHYSSLSDQNIMLIQNAGITLEEVNLTPKTKEIKSRIVLEQDTQQFECQFYYGGEEKLIIYDVTIETEQFYTDNYVTVFCVVALLGVIFILGNRNWSKREDRKKLIIGVLLSGVAIYSLYPYLNDTIWKADDLQYHLLRIEGIKDGMLEGQFPVMIFPNALSGNGYLNCMYPSLFLYFPALLRMANVSLVTSYKCLLLLVNFATVWMMYYSVKELSQSRKAAVLAAALYTLFPYRFTNIYERGALGETIAMAFFPLLFVGLYYVLSGNRKKWYLLVIAMTGFIQSHILSAFLAGLICVIYALMYLKQIRNEKRILEICKAIFWTGLLNLWYLVPFLMYYGYENLWTECLGWYIPKNYVINAGMLVETISFDCYESYSLGGALIIGFVVALIYFIVHKPDNKIDKWMLQMMILACICAYLTTDSFVGWELMDGTFFGYLISSIQFPWRLLTISGCVLSILGAIYIEKLPIVSWGKQGIMFIMIMLTLVSICKTVDMPVYGQEHPIDIDGHIAKVVGIPFWEGSAKSYPYDWRPEGSDDSTIVSEPFLSDAQLIEMKDYTKQGTNVSYEYRTWNEKQYIEVPLLAYMGYTAYDENRNKLEIHRDILSGNRIRINLEPDGKWHTVSITYTGYWYMIVANIISVVAVAYLIVYYWKYSQKTGVKA